MQEVDLRLEERVDDLHARLVRINPRKNVKDAKKAIRAALTHYLMAAVA